MNRILALIGSGMIFAFLGLLIGYPISRAGYYIYNQGYFARWIPLGPTPADTVELADSRPEGLYVRTANGDIFERQRIEEVVTWVKSALPAPAPQEMYMNWETTHPCKRDWPAFAFFSGAPNHIADCLQNDMQYFEGSSKSIYVLDKNGLLWEWVVGNTWGTGAAFFVVGEFSCTLLGLLFGFSLVLQSWGRDYIDRKKTKPTAPPGKLIRVARFVIAGIVLGWSVGLVLTYLYQNGCGVQWRPLGPAPDGTVELPASRGIKLYARTADDDLYERQVKWGDDSWITGKVPNYPQNDWDWKTIHPCKRDWPAFAFFSKVPGDIVDCVQDQNPVGEYLQKHVYILDRSGMIWIWEWETDLSLKSGCFFVLILAGAVFGVLGGIVSVARRSTRKG